MSLIHQDDENETEAPERELTLSTGALLGIFAGLVLLCALFFALGYTVRGRQNPLPTVATAVTSENAPSASANFNTFKPAAGSPAATHTAPAPVETTQEQPLSDAPAQPEAASSAPKEAAPLAHPPTTVPRPAAPVATAPPAAIPPGSFIVQVAAVSHPEDAEYVVSALKAKGYPAASRTVPQDKLYHIQVGPYSNLKDAEAIKQRLSADGYNNPIVK